MAAGLGEARDLAQRALGVRQVVQDADRHHEVEAIRREGQRLGAGLHGQHGVGQVAARDVDRVTEVDGGDVRAGLGGVVAPAPGAGFWRVCGRIHTLVVSRVVRFSARRA
jgi:hypothetical protein